MSFKIDPADLTPRVDLRNLPAVVYVPTRTLHAAYAAGGPADGSLYNFYTLCNRRIDATARWFEIDKSHPWQGPVSRVHHCKQCQHVIDRDA